MNNLISNPMYRILLALIAGIACGFIISPEWGHALNFFSDLFIRLLRMLIGPIVFCTIVTGIGQHQDLKQAGRIGFKAILYFEVITTFALIVAMGLAHLFKPGYGLAEITSELPSSNLVTGQVTSVYQDLLEMIPQSLFSPFVEGNLLHILFIAIMLGMAIVLMPDHSKPILRSFTLFNQLLFKLLYFVILLAPLAVFGAMAYTISKFGLQTLINLGEVIILVFVSCGLFITLVLGLVCRCLDLKLSKILYFIREEILLTLSTSS